ncbi:MAG: pyridoxamine 5'-phosphate oxidase [Proteiniphilum sp.]|jgi:pyridoxamine 5'-phosphate oxidase|nr:pyridoxamine 5'-phosphate oxidase [Proteiniphilum sp.]NCD15326.1 pyridoxamine 5'-phosphate oxidase [Bacteroidia bacterium]HHT33739.1 pyridoxamine 5'-phosphate oxidase [Bacteroidales bacterium]MDD3333165.1 pyridoxamine 5'-phosphate oxidase [Proteiniphilum sp.]MDD3556269.1 pyridoxamine 5'-phosphate oxidase [Proteiniphilum sp.]
MKKLHKMRREYDSGALQEQEMAADPMEMFARWLEEAIAAGIDEPNAMTLATATPEGKPSARVVLLKEMTRNGFTFFTNYRSRKGEELRLNPYAALVFDWHEMARQVRIEGAVEQLPPDESDAYYLSRPENARIGAWTSPQSRVVADRGELDALQREVEQRFAQEPLPRPDHWGGYLVRPERIEFWQGRPNRMHDRLVYEKNEEEWSLQRLAP